MIATGLDILKNDKSAQKLCQGNIAYLCHNASYSAKFENGIAIIQEIFGERLVALFGPQHGVFTDVQDNMVETEHGAHPYFNLPCHSLYSETRVPTKEMLKGVDTIIFDLQDVGTRVYTYIHTLSLVMKACSENQVRLVVLDRPNPIGGEAVEGNVLNPKFSSFVGLHPISMRHGMTMAEMAKFLKQIAYQDVDLHIVAMNGWKRAMYFDKTQLAFIPPSPNIPRFESTLVYPGTVLMEGTSISEGRGTTKPFEIVGMPGIEAFAFCEHLSSVLENSKISGVNLRPIHFQPTFQKHVDKTCGGIEIYITQPKTFKPWHFSQILMRELFHFQQPSFDWNSPPYEYEKEKLPIDILNGSDAPRKWVEKNGSLEELDEIERCGFSEFLKQRESSLIKSYK